VRERERERETQGLMHARQAPYHWAISTTRPWFLEQKPLQWDIHCFISCIFFFLKIGSSYIVQVILKLAILLLPQPPMCWDYRWTPLHPVLMHVLLKEKWKAENAFFRTVLNRCYRKPKIWHLKTWLWEIRLCHLKCVCVFGVRIIVSWLLYKL
jgi:hypothetical protein